MPLTTPWKSSSPPPKKDRLSVGGIATINIDFIMAELVSQQTGFELKYVPFNDEGEMISALLSKSLVMIASNPAEVIGIVESGDAKALAFSGKQPMRSLPDVPTFEELGYNIDVSTPRGLVLAPGVDQGSAAVVDRHDREGHREA